MSARLFLRLVLVVVLLGAAYAGVLVTVSPHRGLLALAFALALGPVAVLAEDRSRAARRAGAAPVARGPQKTRAAAV